MKRNTTRFIATFLAITLISAVTFPLVTSASGIDDYNVSYKYTLSNAQYKVYSLKPGAYEYTEDDKDASRSYYMSMCPGITEYDEFGDGRNTATRSYNCHNYAWQSGTTKHLYWLNHAEYSYDETTGVEVFISDAHTHQLSSAAVGCIAVYYKNGHPVHSGIVTAVSGGAATMIRSKWGASCVFCHSPSNVPPNYKQGSSPNIVYYSVDTNHSPHNVYGINNSQYHKGSCSDCGRTYLSFAHSFVYSLSSTPAVGHNKTCSGCGETYVEGHTFRTAGVWYICNYCGYRTKTPGGQVTGDQSDE